MVKVRFKIDSAKTWVEYRSLAECRLECNHGCLHVLLSESNTRLKIVVVHGVEDDRTENVHCF